MRIVTLIVAALLILPSASWAQDEGDLLRGFTTQEQASMRGACRGQGYSGPAAFYQCLQQQVTTLRNSPGEPDLSTFTAQEQGSMRGACRGQGYSGPAAFYQCLQQQVTTLRNSPGEPDLSTFTAQEQGSMRGACRGQGYSGPAAFYQCLQQQVTTLRNSLGEPDLSTFTTQEQASMRGACRGQSYSGPAVFYQCLQQQVTTLRNSPGEPDLSTFTAQEQGSMRGACRGQGYSGPAAFYQCLQQQVTTLRNSPGEPDLSTFTAQEQGSMRGACRGQGYSGPAAFYQCLQQQVTALSGIRGTLSEPLPSQAEEPLPQENPEVSKLAAATPPVSTQADAIPRRSPAPDPYPVSTPPRSLPPPSWFPMRSEGSTSIQRPGDINSWVFWLAPVLIGLFWLSMRQPCRNCQAPRAFAGGLCAACQREARESAAREAEQTRQRAEEERLRSFRTMEDLHRLSGVEFEEVIAKLFAKLGCQIGRTAVTGDEGIDLLLHVDGVKLVVQCKRWKGGIGAPVVRDFFGALMHADATHGFIITTARFTKRAVRFASHKPLTLIDGSLLLKWLDGSHQPKVTGYARRDEPITRQKHSGSTS